MKGSPDQIWIWGRMLKKPVTCGDRKYTQTVYQIISADIYVDADGSVNTDADADVDTDADADENVKENLYGASVVDDSGSNEGKSRVDHQDNNKPILLHL